MVDAKALKEANRKAFLDVYPELANEVLEELRKYNMPEDAYEWTKQVCQTHPYCAPFPGTVSDYSAMPLILL
jgi:hypothetical protein